MRLRPGRCATAAADLASHYDARNGNDNYAGRLAEAREHTGLDLPLDLGSTNLLLRAQTATASPAPVSDADRADRFRLALHTGARQDAAVYADPGLDLPPAEKLRHLFNVLQFRHNGDSGDSGNDGDAVRQANTAYLAEIAAQDRPEAEFLSSRPFEELMDIPAEHFDRWRDEIDRLTSGSDSWALLSARLVTALMVASRGESEEGVLRTRELIARLREAGRLSDHGLTAVNWFSVRLGRGELADPPSEYRALREDLTWPTTVALDVLFAQAAARAGTEDGFPVIDRLLGMLIDLGIREVTARVVLGSVDSLIPSGRRPEAVERAQLAVRELAAAGYPTRDAELTYGESLSYAGRYAEAREVLEPLLVPRLQNRDADRAFTGPELDAILALGMSLAGHPSTAEPAGWVLLQLRDIALEQDEAALAVTAVNHFTDLASRMENHAAVVEQLGRTLPAAMTLSDDRQAELRLRDRMAVAQAAAGDSAALDTLQENLGRALTASDQVYVRESFNRVLYTFGRLDEALNGCGEIAAIMVDRGDPDNAAEQFTQGAQYAVWSEDLPAAVRILEQAVAVPGGGARFIGDVLLQPGESHRRSGAAGGRRPVACGG